MRTACVSGVAAVVAALGLAASAASGDVLDLTQPMSRGTLNGAIFETSDFSGAGTGLLNSFVRIQASGFEEGYNTSGRPVPFDELTSPGFTRDLRLREIPVRTIGDADYLEFVLDINQSSNGNELSLDRLQIYTSPTGSQNTTSVSTLGALCYDLDTTTDNWVRMDYNLSAGSGRGDVRMYLPVSSVAGAGPDDFIYLYSAFGTNVSSNDGFEEWGVYPVPGPGAPALLGAALLLLARRRSR